MDDEELTKLLEEKNISVPVTIDISRVKQIIVTYEANPNEPIPIMGSVAATKLFTELRQLVKEYYGIS